MTDYQVSMHRYLAEQCLIADDSSTHTRRENYPPPVVPSVYTNHLIIDVADATNAETDHVTEYAVAPHFGRGGAIEGTGEVYNVYMKGFWLPTPEDAAAASAGEYWVSWSALGNYYHGFPASGSHPVFPMVADSTDTTRTRVLPVAHSLTINNPVRLEPGLLSVCSAAAPLSLRQVRYTASCVYDGVNITITLGEGHGVVAGDIMHAYVKDRATALSQFARVCPHGSVVASVTSTAVVAPCSGAAGETTIKVVVGSRWIRIPVTISSLYPQHTNYLSV